MHWSLQVLINQQKTFLMLDCIADRQIFNGKTSTDWCSDTASLSVHLSSLSVAAEATAASVAVFVAGECCEEEVVQMFLQSFESPSVNGELTFREFEEYYEGLSVSMSSDEDFCSVLRNAWSI